MSNDAEWAAVFANSDAALSGKIVEITGTNFTVRGIGARIFSPALVVRSADGSSSLPGLNFTGNITGLHLVDLHIKVVGWPAPNPCINFNLHTFNDYKEIRGSRRHGYGPAGVDIITDFDYPEYGRPNHTGTATTTSQAVALTWLDPARSSGWIEFWNNSANTIYVKAGNSSVVATASDTVCAPNARTRLTVGPTNSHLAVLAATGTANFNFKTEIGMAVYLADAYSSGGSAKINSGSFIGVSYRNLSNAMKFLPDLLGSTLVMDNTFSRIYQDLFSNGWSKLAGSVLHLYRNVFCQPFCLSGIDTNGDARDPHGDLVQLFLETTAESVISAGNRCIREPLRAGAGNQGAHYWEGSGGPGYKNTYVINDLLFLQSQNGIAMTPCEYAYVYGCTIFDPEAPIGSAGGRVNVGSVNGSNSFVGSSIINSLVNSNPRVGNSAVHLLQGGAMIDRFPSFANLFTATTVAQVEAALAAAGAADGLGAVATKGVINWTTQDPNLVVNWAALPSGVAYPTQFDLNPSSVVTTDIRKVMGGPTTMAITTSAGTEYRITSDLAGSVVVADWSSTAGTVAKGHFVQLRGTTSATYSTLVTLGATINGFPVSAGLVTGEDPALMFTTSGTGPGFTDPSTTSGALASLTAKVRVRPTAISGTQTLWSLHSGPTFIAEILSSGALRITVRDSASTQIKQVSTAAGTFVAGQWYTVLSSVDLPNRTLRLWINGALVIDAVLDANTGNLGSSKKLHFLRTGTGTNRFVGNAMYLKAWRSDVSSDGSDPTSAAYVSIIGPAAVANAHTWKVDANAT